MHLDEGKTYSYQMPDVPTDIAHLWLLKYAKLVFVSNTGSQKDTPVLLELKTGQTKRLGEYEQVGVLENPVSNFGEDLIGVAWYARTSNTSGYDYFDINGNPVVNLVRTGFDQARHTYFLAPTKDRAVVIAQTGGRGNYAVLLAIANVSDWLELSQSVPISDAIWAEDGSRFAQLYLNAADPQYLDLEVYTKHGQREHRFEALRINQGFLQETRWTQCR